MVQGVVELICHDRAEVLDVKSRQWESEELVMGERVAGWYEVQVERMTLLRVKEWICIIIPVLLSSEMERYV